MLLERVWLMLLIGCAALGASLAPQGLAPESTSATLPAPDAATTPSAVAALPPVSAPPAADAEATSPDDAIVEQILERFALRHTALSLRERRALAHTIVAEARAHGLEPDLVMAVIEVESAGYPLAVSHVGALGLMQLLPSTGEELAGKLGIEWKGPDTLFDPTINVQLGTAYLRELSDRYRGDVNLALAAYNWGPGRIDRRLRRGASVPSRYIEQVRSAEDRYAAIATTRS